LLAYVPPRHSKFSQSDISQVYGGNISAARFALIAQLNEFVHDNKQKLEAMFEVSDMESSGKVSKFEAVRIMTSAGFPLNIEELEDALEVIAEKAPKGYVEYKAVLTKLSSLTFDMPEIFESLTSVHFAPTHLYRVVGGRIRDCYPRFLACLSEEDSEGNGVVSRAALLRILKGVHLEISEQALNEVIRASGVKPNLRHQINLHHFISRFVPSHRPPSEGRYAELAERARVPREINNAPAMNPDQLLEKLKEKMEDHIKYPRDMFLKLDTDKDGTLTKQELEKAFLHFNLYPKASDVDAL
jgi:Ca2+-binding EF-hand superfamily protein